MRSLLRPALWTSLFALLVPLSWSSVGCVISDGTPIGDTGGTCDIGSEGCPCTSGGMCNDPFFCNDNLNICVSDPCPVGTETCACTPMGVCDPGLMCSSDLCVEEGCGPGTEACNCTEGGGCDPGLDCLSGLCVDASGTDGAPSTGTDTGTADDTTAGPATGTGADDTAGSTGTASSTGG